MERIRPPDSTTSGRSMRDVRDWDRTEWKGLRVSSGSVWVSVCHGVPLSSSTGPSSDRPRLFLRPPFGSRSQRNFLSLFSKSTHSPLTTTVSDPSPLYTTLPSRLPRRVGPSTSHYRPPSGLQVVRDDTPEPLLSTVETEPEGMLIPLVSPTKLLNKKV